MSADFRVEVTRIDEIFEHPNADRLELATVEGKSWNVVVGKGQFKPGGLAVFIPTDSVLPPEIEGKIFGPDSKIGLKNGRVRTIRIRGAVSQGILADPSQLGVKAEVGTDLTSLLGIVKYEQPVRNSGVQGARGRQATRLELNPNFHRYTDIARIQNYKGAFEADEDVVVTEKIHGCNFRAGWVPAVKPRGLFGRLGWHVKGLLGIRPEWQFVFGSRKVQLQEKMLNDTYYDTNVWARAVKQYDLKARIPWGVVVYGEIYGPGIQKNYHYGVPQGEIELAVFDVMVEGSYMDPLRAHNYTETALLLDYVPILYIGSFGSIDFARYDGSDSLLCPEQKVMEGVVVRPKQESTFYGGRKILKWISPAYDEKDDNTEFH